MAEIKRSEVFDNTFYKFVRGSGRFVLTSGRLRETSVRGASIKV